MTHTFEVRHVSVSIERSPDETYRHASDIANWPEWAHGIGASVERAERGDGWIASGPLGKVTVRFAPPNPFRVLDHDVTLPNGLTFHNAFRIIPNGGGSEAVFAVLRQPDATNEAFAADVAAVENDLRRLKQLLERA